MSVWGRGCNRTSKYLVKLVKLFPKAVFCFFPRLKLDLYFLLQLLLSHLEMSVLGGVLFLPQIFCVCHIKLFPKSSCCFFSDKNGSMLSSFQLLLLHLEMSVLGGEDVTAPLNICPSKWDKNIPFIDEHPKNISNSRILHFVRT